MTAVIYPAYPPTQVFVASTQPKSAFLDLRGSKEFDANLCGCCEEIKLCCYAICCGLCLKFDLEKSLDEVYCLTPSAMLRQKIRHARGISGTACGDILIMGLPCTEDCGYCQMYRELKSAGRLETCCCGPC